MRLPPRRALVLEMAVRSDGKEKSARSDMKRKEHELTIQMTGFASRGSKTGRANGCLE